MDLILLVNRHNIFKLNTNSSKKVSKIKKRQYNKLPLMIVQSSLLYNSINQYHSKWLELILLSQIPGEQELWQEDTGITNKDLHLDTKTLLKT